MILVASTRAGASKLIAEAGVRVENRVETGEFGAKKTVELAFAQPYTPAMIATVNLPARAEMERATYERDKSYDGLFYACVKSTGIFCKPSCPARKPRSHNIVFYPTVRDCLLHNFRPCLRCRPLEVGQGPKWLSALLNQIEQSPAGRFSDQDIRDLGVSPHRARRYFTENFGMTFQAFHRARRMGLALEQLRRGEDPLMVGYDHGYESASGFRDAFEKTFGASPGRSDRIVCIKTSCVETPIGPMVAGAVEDGICLLEFADRRALQKQIASLRIHLGGSGSMNGHQTDGRRLAVAAAGGATRRDSGSYGNRVASAVSERPSRTAVRHLAAIVPGTNEHLRQLATELNEYFAGRLRKFTVATCAPGTSFQQKVWQQLREIPYGGTCSYEQLAKKCGCDGAARAVGRANGDNRIAILIPCHRVVKNDGTLGGYGGGKWRKQSLLDLERGQRSLPESYS